MIIKLTKEQQEEYNRNVTIIELKQVVDELYYLDSILNVYLDENETN